MLTASAPGKIILLGEHAVNRGEAAIALAIGLRARCTVRHAEAPGYGLSAGAHHERASFAEASAFRQRIDAMRRAGDVGSIRAVARTDFLAPARYVLAALHDDVSLAPFDAHIESDLTTGAGLGSGAAASSACALAAAALAGVTMEPARVAELAWYGDIIAHGGVASALDASACALGGVVRYDLEGGAVAVSAPADLRIVVADSGVKADTAEINGRVQAWTAERPGRLRYFRAIGALVGSGAQALAAGEIDTIGRLMLLDQLVLERIGVSTPEIDQLVEAALDAGALGAKLSGSGGGGIVIALCADGRHEEVAAAMADAGGQVTLLSAGVSGARIDAEPAAPPSLSQRTTEVSG